MKTVLTKDMVAHIWAQQSQDEGRTASGNFYFKGETLYSYGRHFIVGRFVTHKGKTAVLLNSNRYSVTTSSQLLLAGRAINTARYPVFTVPHLSEYSNVRAGTGGQNAFYELATVANKAFYVQEIAAIIKRALLATKYGSLHHEQAVSMTTHANEYSKFFGLRWKLAMPVFTDELRARFKATRAKFEVDKAGRIKRWKDGQFMHKCMNFDECFLRVRGDSVQTSDGASVPVEHARHVWPLIKRCHDNKHAWATNGHTEHLGSFKLERVTADGDIKVGCHFIRWAEVERMSHIIIEGV